MQIALRERLSYNDSSAYKGGIQTTTMVLLQELDEAQEAYDKCNRVLLKKDINGIKPVHRITFEHIRVLHQYFTNLQTEIKTISIDWPALQGEEILRVGKVIKQHWHPEEKPVFIYSKNPMCLKRTRRRRCLTQTL